MFFTRNNLVVVFLGLCLFGPATTRAADDKDCARFMALVQLGFEISQRQKALDAMAPTAEGYEQLKATLAAMRRLHDEEREELYRDLPDAPREIVPPARPRMPRGLRAALDLSAQDALVILRRPGFLDTAETSTNPVERSLYRAVAKVAQIVHVTPAQMVENLRWARNGVELSEPLWKNLDGCLDGIGNRRKENVEDFLGHYLSDLRP